MGSHHLQVLCLTVVSMKHARSFGPGQECIYVAFSHAKTLSVLYTTDFDPVDHKITTEMERMRTNPTCIHSWIPEIPGAPKTKLVHSGTSQYTLLS